MMRDLPAVEPNYEATIPGMLVHNAARFGDLPAVMHEDHTITYRKLNDQSAAMALGLLAMGVGKGMRVGILLPNGPDFVTVFAAVTRIGAIAAPLSTLYQGPELVGVLKSAAIRFLICADRYRSHDYLTRLEEALPGLAEQRPGALAVPHAPNLRAVMVIGDTGRPWASSLFAEVERVLAERSGFTDQMLAASEAVVRPTDPVCIIHTSGSTAAPKGVVHCHSALIRHTFQMATEFSPLGEGDRVMAMRPFFWVGGLVAQLFYCLQVGACHVSPNDYSDETVLRLIEDRGVTMLAGDESWFQKLRVAPLLCGAGIEVVEISAEFAAIARIGSDGSPAFVSSSLTARMPIVEHIAVERLPWTFGMTEMLGAHTSLPFQVFCPDDRDRVGGLPVPGVRARIRNPETGEAVAPGEQGELEVRGYSMMLGMDGREPAELWTDDGFYCTGDVATIDADGYVTLIGRLGDGFKSKGANVAPLEVELALYGFTEIERCCVLPVPNPHRQGDNIVVAVIQTRSDAPVDEQAIIGGLRTRLSSYKVPERLFHFRLEDMPVTGSGKIVKPALLEMVSERMDLK
jgi:acyl-CoA synthetase (AMP-forming)/AMP-acid ligase II